MTKIVYYKNVKRKKQSLWLKIKLENCYGISYLEKDFDFTEQKTFTIYSPNGTMKTSFANTFKDFSNDKETKDLIYENKIPVRDILDENSNPLTRENVFVVDSYDPKYESEKMSTLLVNKTLKTDLTFMPLSTTIIKRISST